MHEEKEQNDEKNEDEGKIYRRNQPLLYILTSVACAADPSVIMSSTEFSFQNPLFWNLFEFSVAEIT